MTSRHLVSTHGSGTDSRPGWNVVPFALTLALGLLGGTATASKSERIPPAVPGASADWWSHVRKDFEREEYQAEPREAGRGFQAPMTVSPLSTSPSWTAEGNQISAIFGHSVATAGDVNGDGFSDVIVGSIVYDNGQDNEGRAYLFLGSANGLQLSPAWTAESNQSGARFGCSVGTAGDVNGDGFADVIVGAQEYRVNNDLVGAAFVYLGSAGGLATSPAWTVHSQVNSHFGNSVGTAGDVNRDGFADVIVGAVDFTNGQTSEGKAFVYHGSATGLSTTPSWSVESNQAGAFLGHSVATAGDVNGDGFSDVIVGISHYDNALTNEGQARVYHGSPGGLLLTAAWTAESNQANAYFGTSVATAGDVNGDGFADVIVGAPDYDNGHEDEGRAFAYLGSATGLALNPAWTAEAEQIDSAFGTVVASAGDVNGDGYSEVIVGAPLNEVIEIDEGRAFVYGGSASGLSMSFVWMAQPDQAMAYFGGAVMGAGDIDGNGFSDVMVGARLFDNGQQDEGRAFAYHGSAGGLLVQSTWIADNNQSFSRFSFTVATAGDVNGDGFSDVIIGAPFFDNGEANEGRVVAYHGSRAGLSTQPAWTAESNLEEAHFGYNVASAGDVNGDGFYDIIVGAPGLDLGLDSDGRAYVFHGSGNGLSLTPSWVKQDDQNTSSFGFSVSGAGDVNGDGFADVIVGAPSYTNGQTAEGRAFVYLGSAAGLSSSAAWSSESQQAEAQFGVSVSTAGDVNRDGFSEVIVGADWYDNGELDEGRAYVYHGSVTGLATSPVWTREGNRSFAHYGFSVATAGDPNGDGYSDVLVGAPGYTNFEIEQGRAFAYHGGPAGLSLNPNWSAEGNATADQLGWAVAQAGDVNADGYTDAIIGVPSYGSFSGHDEEGQALVYHGTLMLGLAPEPAWSAEGNQPDAFLGQAVATAGDVNGDGFSDVVVGAPFYDNGHLDEGFALLYQGNARSLAVNPRQHTTNGFPPIAILGRSNSQTAVQLRVIGRTPAGRGRVRMQYEMKPLGVPLDGTGIVNGPWMDTGAPVSGLGSTVEIPQLASGLAPSTVYHWRLRLLTDSPFAPRSHWLTLPYNAASEADFRTRNVIGIAEVPAAPEARLWLEPSAPNPFAASTTIRFALPQAGRLQLAIFDVQGRVVASLVDQEQGAGRYTTAWDGRDARGHHLPAGIYFLRLEHNGESETQKLVRTWN